MSLVGKKWMIQNEQEDLDVIEKLLLNRNIKTDDERRFFFDAGLEGMHDPYLMKDMQKAIDRIQAAIAAEEKIVIFGDYDVDGMSSTAIVYDFLKQVGTDVSYQLPNRDKDGYGLKDYFIDQFNENGISLIITVDCGIANAAEVKKAKDLGIDVVITDHHSMPDQIPVAVAVVNPQQEDCDYPNKVASGSLVAYKLIAALAPLYLEGDKLKAFMDEKIALATLGLVSDCMPLVGENRIVTKEGLRLLSDGIHPGVAKLMEKAYSSDGKVTSTSIGFHIGPRLNAAGRIDSPDHGLELLLGDLEKAGYLEKLNIQRQGIVRKAMEEAQAMIDQKEEVPRIIMLIHPEWNAGILGLIAGRIADHYNRPTIVMQDRGAEFVASCRSVNDFDITGFLREHAQDLFTAFGGHKLAGGFTLPQENLDALIEKVEEMGKEAIDPNDFQGSLPIDCEIKGDEMNFDTCHKMDTLEPFGHGNPEPTLMIRGVKIRDIKPVGKQGEHLQIPLEHEGKKLNSIAFRFGQHLDKIDPAKSYDIAFNMEINEWNGFRKLQLKVVDLRASDVPS